MRNFLVLLSDNSTINIWESYNNVGEDSENYDSVLRFEWNDCDGEKINSGELDYNSTEIRDDEYLVQQVLDIAGVPNEVHVKEIKTPFYELILTEPPMGDGIYSKKG